MSQEKILNVIEKFHKILPKFPDGRINYRNSKIAPVIVVFIRYKEKILLLKRSNKVRTYKGKWNAVAGYLDELKPIKEKILEELKEEINIKENIISLIKIGKPFKFKDTKINKTWITYPILIKLKEKPNIKLDREHSEFKWINIKEIEDFNTVPHLNKSLNNAI